MQQPILTTQSISSSPDWMPVRAIGELLANAIDANREVSCSISDILVKYTKNLSLGKPQNNYFELVIKDNGRGIQKKNLISQGESSKRNVSSESMYLGYHGKGMLESFAVLLRNGYSIKIKSEFVNVEVSESQNGNLEYHTADTDTDIDAEGEGSPKNVVFKNVIPRNDAPVDESTQSSSSSVITSVFNFFKDDTTSESPHPNEEFTPHHDYKGTQIYGTQIYLSKNEDFRSVVENLEKNFIFFNRSKGKLVHTTKHGNIYLPNTDYDITQNSPKIFLNGYYLNVEGGTHANCYYVYDLKSVELDLIIRNTDSGNNRKIQSRTIAPFIRKIHEEVTSPKMIKQARVFILKNEYEFKDKIIQKKYASKKIKKDSIEKSEGSDERDEFPSLKVVEVENITRARSNESLHLGYSRRKCILYLKNKDEDDINLLEDFLKENKIRYKFL